MITIFLVGATKYFSASVSTSSPVEHPKDKTLKSLECVDANLDAVVKISGYLSFSVFVRNWIVLSATPAPLWSFFFLRRYRFFHFEKNMINTAFSERAYVI